MRTSIIKMVSAFFAAAIITGCGGGGGEEEVAVQEAPPAVVQPAPSAPAAPATSLPPVAGAIGLGDTYFPNLSVGVPEDLRVDFYGDSVLLGVGVEFSPVTRIAQARPGWIIDHHYAGGLSSQNVLDGYTAQTPAMLEAYMPFGPQLPFNQIKREAKIVVLQLGYNDAFRGGTDYYANMRKLILQVKSEGRIPVLTGVFKSELSVELQAHYNQITLDLAREFKLETADWGEITYWNGGSGSDNIHRTQQNSDDLAVILMMTIERALIYPQS